MNSHTYVYCVYVLLVHAANVLDDYGPLNERHVDTFGMTMRHYFDLVSYKESLVNINQLEVTN